jgi:hypothetical protein
MDKTYLGDSVYVTIEHDIIKLYTSNGISIDNTIYLEPEVLNSLINFAKNNNIIPES